MPSISVVIPTHNDHLYLERALRSVGAQTRKPDEVIIVDDGSNYEPWAKHLMPPRWQWIRHPFNRGAGAARNTGIRAATYKWIAFLDADDEWDPDKLAVVEDYIHADPIADVFCHSERGLNYYAMSELDGRPLHIQSYHRSILSTSAVVCRKDVLMKVGLFDESIRSGIEDFELWQRLSRWKIHFIREYLGTYHNRPGNLTNGRYYAKWRDSMRLAWKYRQRVTVFDMMARIATASGQYGWLGLSDLIRKSVAVRPRSASSAESIHDPQPPLGKP